jgi:hypothetical protein
MISSKLLRAGHYTRNAHYQSDNRAGIWFNCLPLSGSARLFLPWQSNPGMTGWPRVGSRTHRRQAGGML